MKVTSAMSPMAAREPAKPVGARQSSHATPIEDTTSPGAASAAVPPGLERALQRLQAQPTESLTKGQANALQHIERNIARYRDNHALVEAAPTTAAGDAAVVPATTPDTPATTAIPDTPAPAVDPTAATAPTTASNVPDAPVAAPLAGTTEAPAASQPATGQTPVEPAAPAATAPLAATADSSSLEASLLASAPPAGSLIDTQA